MERIKLISGPCVIDTLEESQIIAEVLIEISKKYNLELIFKGSFLKANRTSINSFVGHGSKGLEILKHIRDTYNIPVITDVHESTDVDKVADHVTHLQIPAFLSRQTQLLVAAGKTGLPVNIKKGQFLSPESMKYAYDKVKSTGNYNIFVTERGTTFGYNDLVVDMTSIPRMKTFSKNVILDCTHSVQKPNAANITGGDPEMIETLALAGVAAGATGLFIEVHPEPHKSKSDAKSILQLNKLEGIIKKVMAIRETLAKFE